jgi:lysophospholipase L1-like esterase
VTGSGGSNVGQGGTVGIGGVSTTGGTGTTTGGTSSMGGASSGGAPSGGSSGAASGGAAGGGNTSGMPPCITKPSEIVLIGDSYITGFSGSPALQPAIATIIPTAAMWRNYAIAGMSMAQGGIPLGNPAGVMYIPDQWPEAIAADKDIKLVVMDGGGNDALLPPAGSPAADCKNQATAGTMAACQMLVSTTIAAADKLVMAMASSGVKDVIYFFYPHLPGTGILSGTNPNAIDDYSAPLVQKECESATMKTSGKLNCHFIDLRTPFGSDYTANISGDGVHPTAAGQTIIATQITNLMKSACLGQSSGCCSP